MSSLLYLSCIYRDRAVYGTHALATTDINGEFLEALISRLSLAYSEDSANLC
jgi:hypothetical protein